MLDFLLVISLLTFGFGGSWYVHQETNSYQVEQRQFHKDQQNYNRALQKYEDEYKNYEQED